MQEDFPRVHTVRCLNHTRFKQGSTGRWLWHHYWAGNTRLCISDDQFTLIWVTADHDSVAVHDQAEHKDGD